MTIMSKLKDPNVLVHIGKCYSSGMGFSEIANSIKEKFGIEANYIQIKRIIDIFNSRKSDLIKGDTQLQNMIKGAVLDVDTQLKKINAECFSLLDIAKQSKDSKTIIAAIKEIRNQLEFSHKILNQINDNLISPRVNKLELTQVIVNSLEDLEKQGVIKILKKPDNSKTIGIESELYINEEEKEEEHENQNREDEEESIIAEQRS